MIRKTALSLCLGFIMPAMSLMAQQQAPVKIAPVAPFSGSLYIQGFMQEDPKKEYKHNGQVEVRISIDGNKIAVDSLLEVGRREKDMKVIFDAGAKTMTICEGHSYNDVKSGFIIDLSDKKAKYKSNQDSQSESFKMVNNPDFKFKYSVTDQVQQISEYPCRKILAENAMVSLELWVTDRMGLKISDFDKVFKVTKDLGGTFQLYSMIGSLPDALKNSFPMRIIAREKQYKKRGYDAGNSKKIYRPSVVMLNVVKVDRTIDPKIFDLSGYKLEKKRPFDLEETQDDQGEYNNNAATDSAVRVEPNVGNDNTNAPSAPEKPKDNTQPADIKNAPVLTR